MRRFGTAAFWLWSLLAVLLAAPGAGVAFAQDATPEVATPEVLAPPPATQPPPAPTEAPAAIEAPPAAADSEVVTLVAWYTLSPTGTFLSLYPIQAPPEQPASQTGEPIGRADFPEGRTPILILGDTTFEGYLRFEGEEEFGQRWTWFGDAEGERPATLVFQIAGIDGAYRDYFGTATFVSRDEGSAGGVVVLALRPPTQQPAAGTPIAGT
ncbi:MAG: hypothetical protein M3Q10_03375 [Chloroflexota bacterium]|nr:hypothetical protein [Chloroflexota bacterium]